jgi:hypothetical protein
MLEKDHPVPRLGEKIIKAGQSGSLDSQRGQLILK